MPNQPRRQPAHRRQAGAREPYAQVVFDPKQMAVVVLDVKGMFSLPTSPNDTVGSFRALLMPREFVHAPTGAGRYFVLGKWTSMPSSG